MKMIIAYVKLNKIDDVMLALHKVEGLTGCSNSDVRGFGRDRTASEISLDYKPHIRLELACRDELAEKVVETIEKAAHTGLRGDGKIYVLPVENAVRISSGRRGEQAA
ncbi:nitrogen regulatory protein PII [Desulfosalsimonas propionicica]|uniref:Nitrogen regulatory protein PII n=1 Tax=Desulfosalsimonas propionicica TaxID=332175 RepID=A0A7W0C9Z1_9BACT|nr:P-II family nitrogen regulator [Desulfosalsimonas propionicica]MBA2881896.1 nitrogen regulatory protein PII [Desulfosalsimonas propionicica]